NVQQTTPELSSSSASVPALPSRRRTVPIVLLTTALGLSALVAGVTVASAASSRSLDAMRIVPGVRIATIEVGGLRADEAREKTRDWARVQTAKAIVLHAPQSGRVWNLSLADAGARFDVDGAIAQALAVGQNETLWERIVLGQRKREAMITPPLKL